MLSYFILPYICTWDFPCVSGQKQPKAKEQLPCTGEKYICYSNTYFNLSKNLLHFKRGALAEGFLGGIIDLIWLRFSYLDLKILHLKCLIFQSSFHALS